MTSPHSPAGRPFACLLILLSLLPAAASGDESASAPGGAPSAAPPLHSPSATQWKTASYSFYADEISAAHLFEDFSTNVSAPLTVSRRAQQQTVSGNFRKLGGEQFVRLVCKANSLIWFFDGSMLFIRHVSELARKDLTLDVETFDQAAFARVYDSFAMEGELNRFAVIFDGHVIRLSGLPEYIALVENIVRYVSGDKTALEHGANVGAVDMPVVRMLQVKHGYSEEHLLGLATILARAMGVALQDLSGAPAPPGAGAPAPAAAPDSPALLQGLFGSGLSSKNVEPIEQYAATGTAAAPAAQDAGGPESAPRDDPWSQQAPFVAVNVPLRSIIVRDRLSRIPRYRRLLDELDVAERQIEIAASILDVNSNYSSQLGINIQNNQEQGLLEYQYIPASINDITGFRARLFALVEDGNARVASEPSILTLNNRAAQFKTDQTFYVRLAGDRAVDLVPINFGTVLQVTPNIVGDTEASGQDAKIHLDIHIEDGVRASGSSNVDAIPPVNNTVIDTEALVQGGASLLVGGYQINDENLGVSGIPVLKDIPLLGLLFSTRSRSVKSINRYFVITTRILDYETTEGVAQEDEKAEARISRLTADP